MDIRQKAAGMETQAAVKATAIRNHGPIHPTLKALIVDAAWRGLLPVNLAHWIIRRLHVGAAR